MRITRDKQFFIHIFLPFSIFLPLPLSPSRPSQPQRRPLIWKRASQRKSDCQQQHIGIHTRQIVVGQVGRTRRKHKHTQRRPTGTRETPTHTQADREAKSQREQERQSRELD